MRALLTRARWRASRSRSWRLALVTAVVAIAGPVALAIAARSARTQTPSLTTMLGHQGMPMHMTATASTDGSSMEGAAYWRSVAGSTERSDGKVRTSYISADPVVWDYAPRGRNEITGKPFDEVADTYVKSAPGRIGSRYLKCLYRGYTNGSFRQLEPRPPSQKYLGLLGPVIRAEVGDTIHVVFRNTCPIPTSIHPHGVFYEKSSEGAPYADGTAGKAKRDDAVPTGGRHTYVWKVPERAGPGPGDGSSVMWMYHSHVDEVADTYAGLMGPIEITRRGMARPNGSPKDVDRELFVLFSVMNENNSPFVEQNLHRFAQQPYPPDLGNEEFGESNLMHSINGYVFGSQPMMKMRKGKRVRWYVMSMGTEVDLHTPHWHGNTGTVNGMRMDVVSLLPASMIVADMVPDDPGIWLFHCHVNDHIYAGMLTRYQVLS